MAKNDFQTVIALIRAFFGLLTELVPIASDALNLVDRITEVVKDYKAEKAELKDADLA